MATLDPERGLVAPSWPRWPCLGPRLLFCWSPPCCCWLTLAPWPAVWWWLSASAWANEMHTSPGTSWLQARLYLRKTMSSSLSLVLGNLRSLGHRDVRVTGRPATTKDKKGMFQTGRNRHLKRQIDIIKWIQKKKDGWSNNPKSGNLEKQEVVNSDAFGTEYSQRVTSTRIIFK